MAANELVRRIREEDITVEKLKSDPDFLAEIRRRVISAFEMSDHTFILNIYPLDLIGLNRDKLDITYPLTSVDATVAYFNVDGREEVVPQYTISEEVAVLIFPNLISQNPGVETIHQQASVLRLASEKPLTSGRLLTSEIEWNWLKNWWKNRRRQQ